MPRVALLTDHRYLVPQPGNAYVENILEEDGLLSAGLRERGVETERVDWADPSVPWESFDAAVFRTTWDYFDRFAEFESWLSEVAGRVRLINTPGLVRWNWDKHYLRDLEAAGIATVPTDFVEVGQRLDLMGHLRERGWDDAVVKPVTSGAARHTYRFSPRTAADVQPIVDDLLRAEALMVQPFVGDIVERGEVTAVVVDGRVTHAVLKRAKPGDFRVQDDHGGTVHDHVLSPTEIAFATRAMAACPSPPVYGRVDYALHDDGELRVMELEIIEPELWLRFHPPAADAMADAVSRRLAQVTGVGRDG